MLHTMDLEITITSDGKFLIPRKDTKTNEVIYDIFKDCTDPDCLEAFLSMLNGSELIFGESNLCG